MAVACSTSAFKGSLENALREVSEMGFEFADLICMPQWEHVQPDALVEDFHREATRVEGLLKENSLTPIALNMALPSPHTRDAKTNARRLSQARALARLMNRLGIELASFYPGPKVTGRPWQEVLADSVESIRELLGVAADAGVVFAVELHYNTPFETIPQANALLERLPELPVAYDPSHFAMQEIPVDAVAPLFDRTVHVHLRDAAPGQMFVPLGEGIVDFEAQLQRLQEHGYAGHYSVEYLGTHEGAREEMQELRRMVEQATAEG